MRLLLAAIAFLLLAAPAGAADPGRWTLTGRTTLPPEYFQGLAADPSGIAFAGPQIGLHRADLALRQVATRPAGIHPDVMSAEGYNHIGDLAYDTREGGRLLLPLECYAPFSGADPSDPDNPCLHGSIGLADPVSLAWRYHVRLDPAEIRKVMWLAVDSQRAWTQSGTDLLAYDLDAVSPTAPRPLRASRRIPGVLPGNCTGAAFFRGRLFCAVYSGETFRVWSLSVDSAPALQLEIERTISGEAEGLEVFSGHGGQLHWLIVPDVRTAAPTFGRQFSTLLHFSPAGEPVAGAPERPARIQVRASRRGRRVTVRATTVVAGRTFPVQFATARAGRATVFLDDAGRGRLRLRRGAGRVTVRVSANGLRAGRVRLR